MVYTEWHICCIVYYIPCSLLVIPSNTLELKSLLPAKRRIKTWLRLQYLLWLSPFDVCEGVNQLEMFRWGIAHSEHSLLIYSFTSVRRCKPPQTENYKQAITFVNLLAAMRPMLHMHLKNTSNLVKHFQNPCRQLSWHISHRLSLRRLFLVVTK